MSSFYCPHSPVWLSWWSMALALLGLWVRFPWGSSMNENVSPHYCKLLWSRLFSKCKHGMGTSGNVLCPFLCILLRKASMESNMFSPSNSQKIVNVGCVSPGLNKLSLYIRLNRDFSPQCYPIVYWATTGLKWTEHSLDSPTHPLSLLCSLSLWGKVNLI